MRKLNKKSPVLVMDFKGKRKELEEGKITRAEFDEFFRAAREGLVGASAAPVIMGVSPFGTAEGMFCDYFNTYRKIPEDKNEVKWPFEYGHLIEPLAVEVFNLKTGLNAKLCDMMFSNPNYEGVMCNPDAYFIEDNDLVVVEIKTTYMANSEHAKCFEADIVPYDYYIQVQQQMEICDAKRGILVYMSGLRDYQMKIFPIERDEELGEEICLGCQDFYYALKSGKRPNGLHAENVRGLIADNKKMYAYGNNKLPSLELEKALVPTFLEYEVIEGKISSVKEEIQKATEDLNKELKSLEEKKKDLLAIIEYKVGDYTHAEVNDGKNYFSVDFPEVSEPSFVKKSKDEIKRALGDAFWDNLISKYPKARSIKIKRSVMNK